MSLWGRNMELLYGEEVLRSIGDLMKLFVQLMIYAMILKILGYTVLESMMGGGRFTILLKLVQEGSKAVIELFWERKVLIRFNVSNLSKSDEYD
ncbi:hypothetical protein [Caldivirga maquilingensis]|uniref:Uncharacterized protein n=1 Tax=Caldivirga maquilingensis (strain ATCC 700844 / DSM 13496 / JCM 10307 / IC-167) TaxID=397948 RepID=A8MA23_CALMQ|nr:hypothetical protein [Caldivirga maquilingensis]ABW00955.1 hypothetical protein Cmaq_0101 [Caldivirga maquilingensis IC-167]